MALSPEEWLSQQQPDTQSPEEWLKSAMPEMGSVSGAVFREQTMDEYSMNPRVPALSALAGGVIGLTPFGRVGSALGGVVKGATGGAIGGTAGEAVRAYTDNSNLGQAIAFGAEMAGGAAPNILGEFVSRATPATLGATLGYQKGKAVQSIVGRSESDLAARQASFGRQVMQEGVATSVTQEATKQRFKQTLLNDFGLDIGEKKASDAIRNNIENTLTTQAANKAPLKSSPEFIDLMDRLKEGVRVGAVKPTDYRSIKNILEAQTSVDPKFALEFNRKLVNTIQQATPEWNGIKISDSTAELTREALDNYLTRIGGTPTFSGLKAIEQEEIVAKAVDSIPVVLSDKFRGEAAEKALKNIHKSPEGQKQYRVALASYFRELPPEKVIKEWNRLEDDLIRFKTIPFEDIMKIKRGVVDFSKRTKGVQIAKDISGNALRNSIIRGVLPAEYASLAVQEAESDQSLAIFNQ